MSFLTTNKNGHSNHNHNHNSNHNNKLQVVTRHDITISFNTMVNCFT